MAQTVSSSDSELASRHRSAAAINTAMLVLAGLLIVFAFVAPSFINAPKLIDPTLEFALRIGILVLGLGAIAYRRTKFAAMRLQTVAALRGISGLLATLQKTTVMLSLLGGVIAIMGFAVTLLTTDPGRIDLAGLVAVAVLLYCYPRRAAWQRVVERIEQQGTLDAPPAKGITT